jgi:uncharacterized protein YndB with AHSA1/START domain
MSSTTSIAPVRKGVLVKVDAARAFEIFTSGIDRWWPKTQGVGSSPIAESVIEPFAGGRWFAKYEDGSQITTGHILACEPATRVLFSWEFNADWKPDASAPSEVEVTFTAEEPGTTRVQLEHRLFERMGEEGGTKMRNDVEGGWPALLDLFAIQVAGQSN